MTTMVLPELDEVEGVDTRGDVLEVQADDYRLPLARALKAIEYDEALCVKAWYPEGIKEVIAVLDASPDHHLTAEHKQILCSRDLHSLTEALREEKRLAGVPEGHIIVWALVRVEGPA